MSALASQLSAAGPLPAGETWSTCIPLPLSSEAAAGSSEAAFWTSFGASSGVVGAPQDGTNAGAFTLGTKDGALTLRAFNLLETSISSSSQLSGAPLVAIFQTYITS